MAVNGIWTALVTPFKKDLSIDFNAFEKLLQTQIKAGVHGVIPCGTTGESPTLKQQEKMDLIGFTLKALRGTKIKVFAGTGSNDTRETLLFSTWASSIGVDGVLVVTPYYNKPSQKGLVEHFKAVANGIDCELMLYNVPSRTGVSLTPDTVVELAHHPKIRSLKEASGNVAFTSELLDQVNAVRGLTEFKIFAGDDSTFLPVLSVGGSGVVSVTSNIAPKSMVALYQAFEKNQMTKATKLHHELYPLFRDLFIESNPGPVKFALEQIGIGSSKLRPPLCPMDPKNIKTLLKSLKKSAKN
jgi:4-hydroxy-tetrahydrodipicolinate synthase